MDPLEVLSRIGDEDNAPTDDELREARADFATQLRSAVEAREVAEGANFRQAIQVIDEELEARAEYEA